MLRLTRRSLAIVAAFLTFFAVLPAASAQDWFFRPLANGPYGNGDGKSYNNAWHSDRQITWGSGGIQPGDTLYICGTHDYGLEDQYIAPGISGLSDSQRITIDGRCPRFPGASQAGNFDPGVIFGANDRIADGWVHIDSGVYSRSDIGCVENQVMEDKATRLQRIPEDPDNPSQPATPYADWPAGSFFQNTVSCLTNNPLQYKPTSGSPYSHILHTGRGDPLVDLMGVDFINVRNLDLSNSKTLRGTIRVSDSNHISITGTSIQWAGGIAIAVVKNSDFGVISNNTIHDASNGIYFNVGSDTNDNSDSWLISNNEIYDIDQECFYCHPDSHAIGFQGGSNITVEYNHIHHGGGSGVTFYTFPLQEQMNNTVRYNVIHDIEDMGICSREDIPPTGVRPCRNERGIEHSSSNRDHPETTRNNVAHHNVLYNIRQIALRTKGVRPASGYSWGFFNNTVYSSGTGIQWSEYSVPDDDALDNVVRNPSLVARNNIFLDMTNDFISQASYIAGKDHSGIEFSNNIYYNGQTGNTPGFSWNNQTYSSHPVWAAASTQGANSAYQDPALIAPGNGDFRISENSPAVFSGVPVSSGAAGPITTSSTPHIGALDVAPSTTTTTVTTTTSTTTAPASTTSSTVLQTTTTQIATTTTTAGVTTTTSLPVVTTTLVPVTTTTTPVTTTTTVVTTTTIPAAKVSQAIPPPETTTASIPDVATVETQSDNTTIPEAENTVNASGAATVPEQTSGGGGGCTVQYRSTIDPALPAWILASGIMLFTRRRKRLERAL